MCNRRSFVAANVAAAVWSERLQAGWTRRPAFLTRGVVLVPMDLTLAFHMLAILLVSQEQVMTRF
jgi:hypothetical protein